MHDDGPARGTNRPSEGASTMVRLRLLSVSSAGEAAAVLTADCARGVNPSVTECSADAATNRVANSGRSEEHTSELQSLMRISYAVFCLNKKKRKYTEVINTSHNNTNKPKTN